VPISLSSACAVLCLAPEAFATLLILTQFTQWVRDQAQRCPHLSRGLDRTTGHLQRNERGRR
jgi:hypothetical protein